MQASAIELLDLLKDEDTLIQTHHDPDAFPDDRNPFEDLPDLLDDLDELDKLDELDETNTAIDPFLEELDEDAAWVTIGEREDDHLLTAEFEGELDFLPLDSEENPDSLGQDSAIEASLSPSPVMEVTEDSPSPETDWLATTLALQGEEGDNPEVNGDGDEEEAVWIEPEEPGGLRLTLPILLVGSGLCIASFLGTWFFFSRPCVTASCPPLQQAEQLGMTAAKVAQMDGFSITPADLKQARQQLDEALQRLALVPMDSSHGAAAKTLSTRYQAQRDAIDQILAAQDQAMQAAQKSQDPPHPVAVWEEIQTLWRSAIDSLDTVSRESELYPIAEQKSMEYQSNLAMIEKRIRLERHVVRQLQASKVAASVADKKQEQAQSFKDWEAVTEQWQMAIRPLQTIPQGTTAYEESQTLLSTYQNRQGIARGRKAQEQMSDSAYSEAQKLAQAARQAEQRGDWVKAVSQWQQAITTVQKIPVDTFYYPEMAQLVQTYETALGKAKDESLALSNLQNLRNDLEQACSGETRICNYQVSASTINVSFTPEYEQTLNTVERIEDQTTRNAVLSRIQTLEASLQAISNNAHLPIQVYHSDGSPVGSYTPMF